ncbi:saponin hydrolase precursor [Colletotrichum camelliae]|nr:saponin hydrolase precursor [Colletotrichum camelliae]
MLSAHLLVGLSACLAAAQSIPSPPAPEAFQILELPLPPVAPSADEGACTTSINPHRTGCIAKAVGEFQAGDFTPDGNHIIANVDFVGAAAGSIYTGEQLILIKADGTNFTNGDPWKCISCGVSAANAIALDTQRDYPHVFRSGTKALWGHNILDCGGELLQSNACTPNSTYIYPIHWNTAADGSGKGGSPRELRLHPHDVHMGWSSFTNDGGQFAYFGRLKFNAAPTVGEPLAPRYDLVDVNLLVDPARFEPYTINGTELTIHDDSINVGELRGFSGNGEEITYIANPRESTNIDLFAVHLKTGAVRRLTSHPEYADPMAFSADNDWFIAMDTRGSNRQMWMSGMRGVPPLIDLVAVTVASSTRNNGPRRFFQPILIDRYGDRGDYYGQQVNAVGDGSNGAINDPNWNGRADPAFSLDGTKIVYWQALVVSPSCGGENPLPCPESTAQGGREYRIMLAHRTGREATTPAPVYKVPDEIPWATPFPPGSIVPAQFTVPPGNYTLRGKVSGVADVSITPDANNDGDHILDGHEDVTVKILLPNFWTNQVDWVSDIVQTGVYQAFPMTLEHERAVAAAQSKENWHAIFCGTDGAGLQNPFLIKAIPSSIDIVTNIVTILTAARLERRWIGCGGITVCWYHIGMTASGAAGWGFIGEVSSQRLRPYTAGFGAACSCVISIVMNVLVAYMVNANKWNWGYKMGYFYAGAGLPFTTGMWLLIPDTAVSSATKLDELFERRTQPWRFHRTQTATQNLVN